MKKRGFTTRRGRPVVRAFAATLLVLLALAAAAAQAAPLAPPLPSPQYAGPGSFCVADTGVTPLNCSASDTKIGKLTPLITDACLAVGEPAEVQFTADLVIGATTRWDLAMYIATDGGSALNGASCVKDVLQPVAELNTAGNPTNPDGTGPFKNEDDDSCGEANSTVGALYKLHSITVTCVDANGDSVVDPINTCVSWANNAEQYICDGVNATMPGPGTGSKCYCQDVAPDPPVLIYRGYDWGDLPEGVSYSYQTTTANDGARHAIQDTNNDGTADTITDITQVPNVVVPAVWLGPSVDYSPSGEGDGQPNASATGDDNNNSDDEDGVTVVSPWTAGTNGGTFSVSVNSSDGSTCTNCRLAFWIDWNDNGSFGDAGESYVQNVNFGSNTVTFDTPIVPLLAQNFYARFRLYDGNNASTAVSPTGLVTNGEVEDYYFPNPTAVDLLSFTAQRAERSIILHWKTATEIDNLGFNLYRAKWIDGQRTKLNGGLIPGQAPGSPVGGSYEFVDGAVEPGVRYYYWLEDVDLYGKATVHGPVTAQMGFRDIKLPVVGK